MIKLTIYSGNPRRHNDVTKVIKFTRYNSIRLKNDCKIYRSFNVVAESFRFQGAGCKQTKPNLEHAQLQLTDVGTIRDHQFSQWSLVLLNCTVQYSVQYMYIMMSLCIIPYSLYDTTRWLWQWCGSYFIHLSSITRPRCWMVYSTVYSITTRIVQQLLADG